jgi:uncharacterized protein (DUF2267 family)
MGQESDFHYQLDLLGQLPSEAGRERALKAVFTAIKALIDSSRTAEIADSLPPWLVPAWNDDSMAERELDGTSDAVEMVKVLGKYSYRGAAERVLRAVLGSLVEALDPNGKQSIGNSMPESLVPYWNQANSCSAGENMGEFL